MACSRARAGKWLARAAGLVPLLLATACVPAYPLYVPLETAGNHGYADVRLGPTRFAVSYRAPSAVSFALTKDKRRVDAERRLTVAYDMAVWRASEIALGNGYPAFAIADRSNDIAVSYRYDAYDPLAYHCYRPCFPHNCGCLPGDALYNARPNRYSVIDAGVTITIELEREIRPGTFDAKDAIATLHARYPNALPQAQPHG